MTLPALAVLLSLAGALAASPATADIRPRVTIAEQAVRAPFIPARIDLCGRALRPDPAALVSAAPHGGVTPWPGAYAISFGVRNDSVCDFRGRDGDQRVALSFSGCRAVARMVRPVPDGVVDLRPGDLSLRFSDLPAGDAQNRYVTLILADVTDNCRVTARLRYTNRAAFHDRNFANDDQSFDNNAVTFAIDD